MQYLEMVGIRIAHLRKALGLTQDELSRIVGYTSRSSINKIEKGLVDIPQSKLIEIADALQTTPTYLMGWDDANFASEVTLSEGEQKLLEVYRRAPDDVKPVLIRAMESLESMPLDKLQLVAELIGK